MQNKLPKPKSKLLRLTVSPVYDRGLVLVICRAFIACCCFSRAANMSPKSSCTGVLLFFPAAFDKASCKANKKTFTFSIQKCGNLRWFYLSLLVSILVNLPNKLLHLFIKMNIYICIYTCNFFCSILISEYSWAVARAAAKAFFFWLFARLGTEVVMGIGVWTILIGEFSGKSSNYNNQRKTTVGDSINV